MHSLRLIARRFAAQSGLLVTVGSVALVLATMLSGLAGYLELSAIQSTRSALAAAEPTAASLRVETKRAEDSSAQSAAASALFAREFSGIPIRISRTLIDYPLAVRVNSTPLTLPDGSEARITAGADTQLTEFATLVEGIWPDSTKEPDPASDPATDPGGSTTAATIPAVLQVDAAKALGISVGDVLDFGNEKNPVLVTVVGTWKANDSAAAHWFGNSAVVTGEAAPAGDGTASYGLLMVDESALGSLGPDPFVAWTIELDSASIFPEQLDRLGTVASKLRQTIIDDGKIGKGDITLDGTLATTVATINHQLTSARGVTPVGIILLALMGLGTLAQLARLFFYARRLENALLRSRGASAKWLTIATLGEATIVAVAGSALGYGVAVATLDLIYGNPALGSTPPEYAVLVGVSIMLIFGFGAFVDALRLAKRDTIDDSGRSRTAATVAVTALVGAAAAIAVWQSLLYGSPLVTTASGSQVVDPLAVSAPALALLAIALACLVGFGSLATLAARMSARRRGFQPSYSTRQLARNLGSYSVAVLVITLSVGGLTFTASYSGTWASLNSTAAQLATGADVRLNLPKPSPGQDHGTELDLADYLTVPGVTDATQGFSSGILIGDDDTGKLTALPAGKIASTVSNAHGTINPVRLAADLPKSQLAGIQLPVGTTTLSLDTTLTVTDEFGAPAQTTGVARTTLWFQNLLGGVVSAEQAAVPTTQAGEKTVMTATLPDRTSAWWLVAIDYTTRADSGLLTTTFRNLEATTADGTSHSVEFATTGWGPQVLDLFSLSMKAKADGLEVGIPNAGARTSFVRLMQKNRKASDSLFSSLGESEPVPLVVTAELAKHYDVALGDPLDIRLAENSLTISGVVAGVAPYLPANPSPNGVLVDLTTLNNYFLRSGSDAPKPNEVWLSTSESANTGLRKELDGVAPEGSTIVTPLNAIDASFALPATLALWIAAIGGLVLAACSLGAVTLALSRVRRAEVLVLRAVGVSARAQSRSRMKELLTIIVISTVFGIINGAAVAYLSVSGLAKSTIIGAPSGLTAKVDFAVTPGLALLAIDLMILSLIALGYATRVRSQALNTSERLETR